MENIKLYRNKKKALRAYIYPITNYKVDNPYLNNFINSLNCDIYFVNRNSPSNIGILNLLKYLNKRLHYSFFHWLEDLPDKKFGLIQCYILVYMILPLLRIKKTTIIWTLHNKLSHAPSNIRIKKWLASKLVKQADIILTHSNEGRIFIENLNKNSGKKVLVYHHPVGNLNLPKSNIKKETDLLIWGTVLQYKGVYEFISEFIKESSLNKRRILIAGKIPDYEYYNKLSNINSNQLIIRNEFIEHDELILLMHQSKAVLFTYKNKSVLSSGALMDSLVTGSKIIAPPVGAFNDLAKLGLVNTFNKIDEIEGLLRQEENQNRLQVLKAFCKKNSWKSFGKEFLKEIT